MPPRNTPTNRNINLKLGYNKAIKRPPLNNIAGQWSINTADTSSPFPIPDSSRSGRTNFPRWLEYYFKPAGTVSVHVFQTDIKGAADQTDPMPASAVGLGDDPDLRDLRVLHASKTFPEPAA